MYNINTVEYCLKFTPVSLVLSFPDAVRVQSVSKDKSDKKNILS